MSSTLLTAGPLDDVAYLQQVHAVITAQIARSRTPQLQGLADETWRRLSEAAQERDRLVLRYTGPTLVDFCAGPATAPVPVRIRADGAHALAAAVLNPGRWLRLGADRSRRAWHASLSQALETLRRVDERVASRLSFATTRDSPGIRLVEQEGKVLIRWRPAPSAQLHPH